MSPERHVTSFKDVLLSKMEAIFGQDCTLASKDVTSLCIWCLWVSLCLLKDAKDVKNGLEIFLR